MKPALHYVLLHGDDQVVIHDVLCRAHRSGPGGEECSARFTISVPRRGVFVKHGAEGALTADASRAILFWPGRSYRVSHPAGSGDECTALEFGEGTVRDAADHLGLGSDAALGDGFESVAWCGPALFRLVHRIRQGLRAGTLEAMMVHEAAFAILGAVLAQAGERDSQEGSSRAETRRAHRRVVEATRQAIAVHYDEPLTLGDLASHAGVSSFHLARTFRRATGAPVHRHLNAVRLRAALDRVAAGEHDLTTVALDCGFSSHSHLTNAFRREFGVPPSGLRVPPAPSELRRLSKILQARPGEAR